MKSLALYIIIVVFGVSVMGPNMQGMQLLKIPQLVHHVEYHFGQDWTLSELGSFLSEHYSHNVQDDKDHENLPFKTIVTSVASVVLQYPETMSYQPVLFERSVFKRPAVHPAQPTQDRERVVWTPPQLS